MLVVACASADATISLWSLENPALPVLRSYLDDAQVAPKPIPVDCQTVNSEQVFGHTDDIRSLCYSDISNTLFSAGLDSSILSWDVETGALLCKL